jgi:signal transduction histidine kinase
MWSRALLRVVYLLLGGAVSLALILLYAGVATLLWTWRPGLLGVTLLVIAVVVPVAGVGAVAAVRDLEITAARSLLGSRAEMVQTETPTAAQRRRSSAWVGLHLVAGTVVGTLLVVGLPTCVTLLVEQLRPDPGQLGLGPVGLPVSGAPAVAVLLLAAVALVAICLAAGAAMARLAPVFLGPNAADLLAAAEQRVGHLVERGRLARDLHDGLGHALSVISLQAAAGRRVIDTDPNFARKALEVVEETARLAVDELDAALGALRDGQAPTAPQPGLADLDLLVRAHRAGGVDVRVDVRLGREVPSLVSREAFRIVQEGLTNAVRHSHASAVDVTIRTQTDGLELLVANPIGATARRSRGGGRGLDGLHERARVLGGRVSAGAVDGSWRLHAFLPLQERP